MVKIVYIGILSNEEKEVAELAVEYDMSTFNLFQRSTYGKGATTFAKRIARSTEPDIRQSINLKEEQNAPPFVVHAYGRKEGVCGIVITDEDYPAKAAHGILTKICDDFLTRYRRPAYENITEQYAIDHPNPLPCPEMKDYIKRYQDPEQIDGMMKIQRELDETTKILHKTIASVLDRGEKIDDLVAKSADLNAMSKAFFVQSKKQNSCCVVM